MITDPFAIAFSPARKYQQAAPDQFSIISALASMLPACGWTVTALYYGSCSIDYQTGFPAVTGPPIDPKRIVGCSSPAFVTVGSEGFTPYNPFTEQPAVGAPCNFFALDVVSFVGLQNLASAITAATGFDATAVSVAGPHLRLDLVAKLPGPIGNAVGVQGDGRWGLSTNGQTVGGGYQWESAAGAATYRVAATYQINFAASLSFDFLINGNLPLQNYSISMSGNNAGSVDRYSILTNGYGFVIFDGPDTQSGYPYRAVSLMAMAPYRPPITDPQIPKYEIFDTSAYAVFICGAGSFRSQTSWYGPGVTTSLDGDANTYANKGGFPRILAFRAPGPPLLTQSGVPLVMGAYVMFGQGPLSSAYVIGKLYDCAIVHAQVTGILIIQGQRFLPISSQGGNNAGTATTLMMCIPPAHAGSSGTCNFLLTAVIRLTGDPWTADMVGGPITIGGKPYVVTIFRDDENIQVNDDTVVQLGLPWSIP